MCVCVRCVAFIGRFVLVFLFEISTQPPNVWEWPLFVILRNIIRNTNNDPIFSKYRYRQPHIKPVQSTDHGRFNPFHSHTYPSIYTRLSRHTFFRILASIANTNFTLLRILFFRLSFLICFQWPALWHTILYSVIRIVFLFFSRYIFAFSL